MSQTRFSSDWSLPEALPEALAIYTKTNDHRITTTEGALNEMAPERSRLAQEADALSRSAFYFNDNAQPQMRAIAKANSDMPLDWREWGALTPQLKPSQAKTADDWLARLTIDEQADGLNKTLKGNNLHGQSSIIRKYSSEIAQASDRLGGQYALTEFDIGQAASTLATKYDAASAKGLRSTNGFMLEGIGACLGASAANIGIDKLLFSNTATTGRTGVIDFVAASAGCLLSRSWVGAATTMVASHLAARIIDQSDQR